MFKSVILIMFVVMSCIEGAVIQNQIVANSQNYYESLYRNYIIETNRQKILQSNQQSLTFKLQVNKFIQYSQDEFEKLFLLTRVASSTQVVSPFKSQPGKNLIIQSNIKLNSTNIYGFTDLDIDWNRAGMVTAVKNQGGCGSCWAFATVSDLESSYLLNGYRGSIDLSQQQLVDCSGSFYNFGCGGGWMTNAFAYIFKNPLTTQSNYPYVANAQTCKTVNGNFSLKNLRSYWQNKNCQLLVDILKSRPLTVAVSADAFYWGFYKSGVLNQCSGTINHGVVVTGVKKNATDDYWIVKNSWGSDWGQNGYLRIDRSQKEGNLCDICSYPQHSIV